jgi:hypothetical protein
MSSLDKFNSTLESFDKEVENLKSVSESYKKLESLVKIFDKANDMLVRNTTHFQSLIDIQGKHHQTISDGIVAIKSQHIQHKTELEKQLSDNLEIIRKENKEFYRDFESTIKIRLDDNKSQIKQLIEIERNQIKQIFEIEFAKNTKEIKQVIEAETENQTQILFKGQNLIKISIWIIGGLTILLCVIAVIKLFNLSSH